MEQYLAESADGRRRLQNAVERRAAAAVGEVTGADEPAPGAPASSSASGHAPAPMADVSMDQAPALPSIEFPPSDSHQLPVADEDVTMDTFEEATDILIFSEDCSHGVGEVYSPPRVVPISIKHGFKGGWSLDQLTKDQDGRSWDFDDPVMRERAGRLVAKGSTLLVIGSPMCTYFSNIMNLAKLRMKEG